MPTQTKKASTNVKPSEAKAKASTRRFAPPVDSQRARAAAGSAVDVPVGAVLELSDRVTDAVAPLRGRAAAEKQLKTYRTQVRRRVKRSERRGATARRGAVKEARRTLEAQTKEARRRIEAQTSRAQDLVDKVAALRR